MTNLDPIDKLSIATIRSLAADVVERAKSGHPGAPMGLAPVAHLLFGYCMNITGASEDGKWSGRDRYAIYLTFDWHFINCFFK